MIRMLSGASGPSPVRDRFTGTKHQDIKRPRTSSAQCGQPVIMVLFQIVSRWTPVVGMSLGIEARPWLSAGVVASNEQPLHSPRVIDHRSR